MAKTPQQIETEMESVLESMTAEKMDYPETRIMYVCGWLLLGLLKTQNAEKSARLAAYAKGLV